MRDWGWLYVAAVFVPLGSFAIQFLAGRVLGRVNAYIATGSIAASFVLSAIGLFAYIAGNSGMLSGEHPHAAAHAEAGEHGQAEADEEHPAEAPHAPTAWTKRFDWVVLGAGLAGEGSPPLTIPLGLHIDGLAAIMFAMVTLIATLIHLYSMGYMSEDPRYPTFFTYLSLFCFSMLGLVASSTIFQVFLFWELVGLCSYLLIGFWYEEKTNSDAANKAFIVNRVGDAGMILGLGLLWTSLGTFSIQEINRDLRAPDGTLNVAKAGADGEAVAELRDRSTGQPRIDATSGLPRQMPVWLLTLAGLGIFAGCVGKSAQFPLHVWLPDAMAGPTPVSALIHAATMVAAGVYLVGRFYPLFTPDVLLVIGYIGGITLLIGASIALVQTDYKRVLAYSTVSQLGFMMLGLGVGGWAAGLFHLITHAFFKALLFLGAGSVYHSVHTYEMPRLGGLYPKMRTTALTMLVGTAAISGVPFFSGFYSKDAILASALAFVEEPGHAKHWLLLALPIFGATLTAFYMFRMWFLLFTGVSRSAVALAGGHVPGMPHAHAHVEHEHEEPHHHAHGDPVEHAHESPPIMTVPLIVLASFAVFVGWPWLIVPLVGGTPVLEGMLAYGAPIPVHEHSLAQMGIALILSLVIAASGIALAAVFYYWRKADPAVVAERARPLHQFLLKKWYFDELYDAIFVRPTMALAHFAANFDKYVIDGIVNGSAFVTAGISRLSGLFDNGLVDGAVNAVGAIIYALGDWGRMLQTGRVRNYLMILAVGVVVLFLGMYRWIQG